MINQGLSAMRMYKDEIDMLRQELTHSKQTLLNVNSES